MTFEILIPPPLTARYEEYCVVRAMNHQAKLSGDFTPPPLKCHSQDATGRQSYRERSPCGRSVSRKQILQCGSYFLRTQGFINVTAMDIR